MIASLVAAPSRTLESLLQVINTSVAEWGELISREGVPAVQELYVTGLKAGTAEAGMAFGATLEDPQAVAFLANEPDGMVPALKDFSKAEQKFAEETIRQAFEADTPFDLDEIVKTLKGRVDKAGSRLRLIVRTETSKVAGLGRLAAWEQDPQRDWYDYHWVATIDGRHKDISEAFMKGGPYTFEQIKQLWLKPEGWVVNRKTGRREYQIDSYNNRCTIARTLKSGERLMAEGLATPEDLELLPV